MRTALKVIIALELVCIVVVVAAVFFVIGDRGASSAEESFAFDDPAVTDQAAGDAADDFAGITEYSRADVERLATATPDETLHEMYSWVSLSGAAGQAIVWGRNGPTAYVSQGSWPVGGVDAQIVYFRDIPDISAVRGQGKAEYDEFPFTRQQHGLSTNTLLDLGMSREDAGRHNGYLFHDGTTIFHVTGQGTPETTVTALSPVSGFREFRF